MKLQEEVYLYLGNPIKGPGPDRGVIFQAPSLMPWMTSLQNVLLGVNQVFPHATKKAAK